MRGRLQALIVTLVGATSLLFSWVGASAIALVTLRLGTAQGLWLLAWGVLPALALYVSFGDPQPLTMLVGTAVAALVLRATVSLSLAVLALVPIGLATALLYPLVAAEQLAALLEFLTGVLEQMQAEINRNGDAAVALQVPTTSQVAGMIGLSNAFICGLCLLLARYWQAALYNPGGFGKEFRELRLPPLATAALVLASVGIASLGVEYRSWASVLLVPLIFSGFALAHAYAGWRNHSSVWLGLFYGLWVLLDPVKLLLIGVAIADSWLDFRRRMGPPAAGPGDKPPAA